MRRIVVGLVAVLALVLPAGASASVRLVQRAQGGPGQYATLSVAVSPSATCSIAVYYKSGASVAQGLYPKRGSRISWTWKIGTRTTPGSWPISISCGRAGSLRTSIRVS